MSNRTTRALWLGLLACIQAIASCGGTPPGASPFGSTFSDGGTSVRVSPPPAAGDDAMAPIDETSAPPIVFQDATAPDVSVNPCPSGACDDATMAAVCGNGVIEMGEQCDDGNSKPGDGCSGICLIEPGYTCPMAGQPCISTVTQTCGNGRIEGSEACDDGNAVDGDGCSAACQVEPGWSCTVPGMPCTKVAATAVCGDGKVNSGEQCDDGNTTPGDGCGATCQLESGWTCPAPGSACQKLQYCGDGVVETAIGEQCDDGNAVPGDGCSGVCKLEPGYACPAAGQPCAKVTSCRSRTHANRNRTNCPTPNPIHWRA